MIFIDSNIPMYLVGRDHAHKTDAQRLLERFIAEQERLVTDAEVLVAIDRRDAIQPAFDAVIGVVDEIFPVEARDAERAKEIVLSSRRVSARDALHLAVMERHGIPRVMSFDAAFDGFPGIERIS